VAFFLTYFIKNIKITTDILTIHPPSPYGLWRAKKEEKMSYKELEKWFAPDPERGIVIYGATDTLSETGEKKFGQAILENVISTYKSKCIYCINPKRAKEGAEILGKKAYANAKDLPTVPDLAIIATPATTIEKIMQECADAGIPAAIVFAAGFQEMGAEGIILAQKVADIAKKGGVRMCGPNCFGVFGEFLNGTFSRGVLAGGGYIGYISQSGAIVCDPLDVIGKVSRVASIGSKIGVTWGEMIRLYGDHNPTKAIFLYFESIEKEADDLIRAAREVGREKLIVALKGGRTEASNKVATSHTGASAGNYKVFLEICRKAGIIIPEDLREADDFLEFAKQPLPKGNRLIILTNGGGKGVLSTDQLELYGGKLAKLSEETLAVLDTHMPPTYSHTNPVDIIGDAPKERWRIAIRAVLAEKDCDGVLITYVPLAMCDPTDLARIVIEEGKKYPDKPILVSFTGSESVSEAKRLFREAGLAVYDQPETAARIFGKLAKRQEELCKDSKLCRETYICRACPRFGNGCEEAKLSADILLHGIHSSGRTTLTEHEAKKILGAHCIPVADTFIAMTEDEAVYIAEKIGYPVVLKLNSTLPNMTHKSDIGGVHRNLKTDMDVKSAFNAIRQIVKANQFEGVNVQPMETTEGVEVVIGSTVDPSGAKVVLFGEGGTLMEYRQDTDIAILPLNQAEVANLIRRTKISKLLIEGWRDVYKPIDMSKLEDILVAFAHFVETHPEVKEVDINPLIVSPEKIIALDARIILHK
jgi:acetyltransferase